MKTDAGSHESVWTATADIPPRPPLTENRSANVCVIGAGIAGLTTAYMLVREGKSVVVLDDGPIAGGETGRTTGHLSNALDDRYMELERLHGEKGARLAAESHTAAIDEIERIVAEEKIECDFRRLDGYLIAASGSDVEDLRSEMEAAHRAGLTDVRMLDRVPLHGFESGTCLCFPRQGQFHVIKYMAGLAEAVERRGGLIFTRTHVKGISSSDHPVVTTESGNTVRCNFAVVATNSPINNMVHIHTKQEPYRTYVIGAAVAKGAVPPILLWDTLDPYHYLRVTSLSDRHDLLIVGGEDHRTGQAHDTDSRFDALESWTRERFPFIEFVEFRWSGQVMEPVDGLGFIGKNPGDTNIFVATGDSGHGITHGTIAGILIRDLTDNADNDWTKLYDPSRKTLKAAGEFATYGFNIAKQYLGVVTAGHSIDAASLAPGTGAVIRRGFEKVAAYLDPAGQLHEMSAVCPHLGCIVDWNDTECTWDCPCHGSRFSPEGKVVNGPANVDLSPCDDPHEPVAVLPVAE